MVRKATQLEQKQPIVYKALLDEVYIFIIICTLLHSLKMMYYQKYFEWYFIGLQMLVFYLVFIVIFLNEFIHAVF